MTFPLFQSILKHFGDFVAISFAHLPICQMLKANWLKAVFESLLVSNIDQQTGFLLAKQFDAEDMTPILSML